MLSLRDTNALSHFEFYAYHPSLAAAVIFVVIFGLATCAHLWQLFRARTWYMIPFLVGGIFETTGYIGRTLSATENPGPYTLGPYIIQSVLLLVSPAFFAASVYMHLGRVVQMADGDDAIIISRKWLTKIFVAGDVLSFLMQSAGAGFLASKDSSKISLGKNIVLGGLGLQLLFFGLFVAAAAIFHLRLSRTPTTTCANVPWRKHLASLYAVSLLILLRSIVRIVEYVQGFDGFILSHEVFIYVFDGLLMWAAMVVMNCIHPGEVARILRNPKRGVADAENGHAVGLMQVRDGGHQTDTSYQPLQS